MPASFFNLTAPRRLVRSAAMLVMGFSISQSQLESLGSKLSDIRQRDVLTCGVDDGRPGFANYDDVSGWSGFEIDLCRAYAAAFLGDPDKVQFLPLLTTQRFDALQSGQIDILLSTTSWTFTRSVDMPVQFAGVYYYDGQGFLIPDDLGVSSARELNGARICVQPATTTLSNVHNFASRYNLTFNYVEVDSFDAGLEAYQNGLCDALTSDVSALAGVRQLMQTPLSHTVLPDIISKEPLSPVVSSNDSEFAEVIRWTNYALIAAEEFGITSLNVHELGVSSERYEVRRLLGTEGVIGEGWALDPQFALNAIKASGHYGEIFERNLGQSSSIGLQRGLNAQWSDGGLLYAPPFG